MCLSQPYLSKIHNMDQTEADNMDGATIAYGVLVYTLLMKFTFYIPILSYCTLDAGFQFTDYEWFPRTFY